MGNISLEVQVDVNIICGHTLNNQVHLLCQLGAYLTIMPGEKKRICNLYCYSTTNCVSHWNLHVFRWWCRKPIWLFKLIIFKPILMSCVLMMIRLITFCSIMVFYFISPIPLIMYLIKVKGAFLIILCGRTVNKCPLLCKLIKKAWLDRISW